MQFVNLITLFTFIRIIISSIDTVQSTTDFYYFFPLNSQSMHNEQNLLLFWQIYL